jgi:hypothetical protein
VGPRGLCPLPNVAAGDTLLTTTGTSSGSSRNAPTHPPHRHELEREPELQVSTATALDQHPVLVIEEEHPLQVRPRRHPRVPAEARRLIISQKLHRHAPRSYGLPAHADQTQTPSRARGTSERWMAVTPFATAR